MENLNFIPIAVAALIPSIMGFIYYHKSVVGGAWMAEMGKTEDQLMKGFNMPLTMGISLVLSFILAFFLNALIELTHKEVSDAGELVYGSFHTFKHGALHGALIGLTIMTPAFVTNGMFERRSWKHIFINIAYWVLTFALMGGLLDAWN